VNHAVDASQRYAPKVSSMSISMDPTDPNASALPSTQHVQSVGNGIHPVFIPSQLLDSQQHSRDQIIMLQGSLRQLMYFSANIPD
jgi:hypothetical protein